MLDPSAGLMVSPAWLPQFGEDRFFPRVRLRFHADDCVHEIRKPNGSALRDLPVCNEVLSTITDAKLVRERDRKADLRVFASPFRTAGGALASRKLWIPAKCARICVASSMRPQQRPETVQKPTVSNCQSVLGVGA